MTLPSKEQIATEFIAALIGEIGNDNYREVCSRNAANKNPNICASHDFCDANMTMHGVLLKHIDAAEDINDEANLALWSEALWNESWDIAHQRMIEEYERWGESWKDELALVDEIAGTARVADGAETSALVNRWITQARQLNGGG